MTQWSPKNVVLAVMACGWVLLGTISIFKGAPLPPMPMLPLQAPAPRIVDGEEEIGVQNVISKDKCFGKNCIVHSLKFNGPGGTDIITFANGRTIHTNNGDSTFIYTDALRPASVFSDGTISNLSSITAGSYLASTAAALTTGAACPVAGALQYDSGNGCTKACNSGLTWSGCLSSSTTTNVVASWGSYCPKANCTKAETNADAFIIPYTPQIAVTPTKATGNWGTAGTGGTTGVVVAVFDITGAAELCSFVLGPCTTAAGTPVNVNSGCGAMTAGHMYVSRLKSTTDCTTIPGLFGVSIDLQ